MQVPYIGLENLLAHPDATVTASSEAADHPIEMALDHFQDTTWQPDPESTGPWTVTLDLPGGEVDYLGLFAHRPQGLAVMLEGYDESTQAWVELLDEALYARACAWWLASTHQYDEFRLTFDGPATDFDLADVRIGLRDALPAGVQTGFPPPNQARNNRVINSETDQGFFVGRTRIRRGISTQLTIAQVAENWVFANWEPPAEQPLADRLELGTFYLGWAPQDLPEHVVLCWTRGPVAPAEYIETTGLMRLQLSVQGVQ